MKDVFNEDYRGSWLLVCVEGDSYSAFIDRKHITDLTGSASPDELLIELRRMVDTRPDPGLQWQAR